MLEQFYRDFHDELTGWCRTKTQDPSLAEDLVQEAFIRAMDHLSLLEQLSRPQVRSWFYRTLGNLYIDRMRWMRFESVCETIPESRQDIPEYDSIDWELLLNSLPGDEGVLFTMRYLGGYTSSEIGALFQIPAGTVRARLSSARKHLKSALKGEKF